MKYQLDLTAREIEILCLSMFGLNNAQIAEILIISQNTVKNHLNIIYSKLNVHNRVQAVIKYIKMGYDAKPNPHLSREYNIAIIKLLLAPPIRSSAIK